MLLPCVIKKKADVAEEQTSCISWLQVKELFKPVHVFQTLFVP
jgi:hypothetical protein